MFWKQAILKKVYGCPQNGCLFWLNLSRFVFSYDVVVVFSIVVDITAVVVCFIAFALIGVVVTTVATVLDVDVAVAVDMH